MLTLLTPSLIHLLNADESRDSICTLCIARVATAQNELELGSFESAHICERAKLLLC
jgi:hypothetical protein